MAELADALDLGSSGATRTGSIPARCTIYFVLAVLAQLAEQLICNHQVVGSIPIDGTT